MDPRAWRRFRRNRGAFVGAALVALVTTIAIAGPWVAPHEPNEPHIDTLLRDNGLPRGPGEVPGFLLGGDTLGRDELSRLLHGGRVSMAVAFFATALALAIGVSVGVLAGYVGGPLDAVSMRGVDLLLSLPFLLVAITLQRVWSSPKLWALYVILGVLSWTTLARVTRAKTMQVRALDYVQAARALGMREGGIVFRHVLPNILGPVIVLGTTMVANMVIAESAMSYLGLGVQPPDASWGSMLLEGQRYFAREPRVLLYPATLIVASVFGFNLLGEGLRDAFDPK